MPFLPPKQTLWEMPHMEMLHACIEAQQLLEAYWKTKKDKIVI